MNLVSATGCFPDLEALYEGTRHHNSIENAERFKIGMEPFLGRNVVRSLIYAISMFKYNPQMLEDGRNLLGVGKGTKTSSKGSVRRLSRLAPDLLTGVEIEDKATAPERPKPKPFLH